MNSILVIFYIIFSFYVYANGIRSEYCTNSKISSENQGFCEIQENLLDKRFILYNVNPREGFNLRRDVYIRIAVFLKQLVEQDKTFLWHLVLPPWENLDHWRSRDAGSQRQLPWGMFFDLQSLQKYIPVMEMYDFFDEYRSKGKRILLDCVYILQNDHKMFETGNFETKNEIIDYKDSSEIFETLHEKQRFFWRYSNITSDNIKRIIFHGVMSDLKQNLKPATYKTIMFHHMEIPLHDSYGSLEYWKARRSMRYNTELYKIANNYRLKYFNSTNEQDNTKRPSNWENEENRRNAIGGAYMSVHLRRGDFLFGRPNFIPTIENTAFQLKVKLEELKLKTLFVATDADEQEFQLLKTYLSGYEIFKFVPSDDMKKKHKDGGVAIIDQIICSYARYFIGTRESTFTYRIQEDREIIGFPPETTFNHLCEGSQNCLKNDGHWKIVWQ